MKTRILVVAWTPLAGTIADGLTNFGYEARSARTGREALEMLETHPVNIVLVENEMPCMSGPEFIGVAKLAYPELRFILMGFDRSFPGYKGIAAVAKACGADAYLNSSLGYWDLAPTIQILMSNRQPRA